MSISLQDCREQDSADPLARCRDAFALPERIIYLDGNSLGALPRATPKRLAAVVEEEWGGDLITSWNKHGWIATPHRIGDKIARLIGAGAGEVVVAESTSINLFKVLSVALSLCPERKVIVSERANFPTDLYMAEGLAALLARGHELRLVERADVMAALDEDVAALYLTHVDFRTGEILDMAGLTAAAHDIGALTIWDLCHSGGAVPVALNDADADFAVGCGYKYLNGGPGAPAFVYAAKRHQVSGEGEAVMERAQPLWGWLGHAAPFEFTPHYRPASGIRQYVCSSPSIVAMAALEVGVDLFLEADIEAVRAKSVLQTKAFIALVEERCAGYGLTLASPRDASRRGSQVSFAHPDGYAVMQALIARGVIGDFRAPDLLRFGFTPLYVRHVDVWDAAEILRDVLATEEWRRPEFARRAEVT
jgi:kynureninase